MPAQFGCPQVSVTHSPQRRSRTRLSTWMYVLPLLEQSPPPGPFAMTEVSSPIARDTLRRGPSCPPLLLRGPTPAALLPRRRPSPCAPRALPLLTGTEMCTPKSKEGVSRFPTHALCTDPAATHTHDRKRCVDIRVEGALHPWGTEGIGAPPPTRWHCGTGMISNRRHPGAADAGRPRCIPAAEVRASLSLSLWGAPVSFCSRELSSPETEGPH